MAAIPLVARIHEGLLFSNRDTRTLLDKLAALLQTVSQAMACLVMLVADAYYASGGLMRFLLGKGHHLISRAKRNAVAHFLPNQTVKETVNLEKFWAYISHPMAVYHQQLMQTLGAEKQSPAFKM